MVPDKLIVMTFMTTSSLGLCTVYIMTFTLHVTIKT